MVARWALLGVAAVLGSWVVLLLENTPAVGPPEAVRAPSRDAPVAIDHFAPLPTANEPEARALRAVAAQPHHCDLVDEVDALQARVAHLEEQVAELEEQNGRLAFELHTERRMAAGEILAPQIEAMLRDEFPHAFADVPLATGVRARFLMAIEQLAFDHGVASLAELRASVLSDAQVTGVAAAFAREWRQSLSLPRTRPVTTFDEHAERCHVTYEVVQDAWTNDVRQQTVLAQGLAGHDPWVQSLHAQHDLLATSTGLEVESILGHEFADPWW